MQREIRGRLVRNQVCCVFFFNHKTAYELRISDSSSDVCSSDLGDRRDIITAAEIIFERRIEAVRRLRPEVGVAARSRILDRVDVGDDIAETGVELAKARPRKDRKSVV